MMKLGVNAPYTDRTWPDETWQLLDRLGPEEITLTSFLDDGAVARLVERYPSAVYHVRPRTGPARIGAWPDNLLDYRSWPTERSLRECLEDLLANGVTPWLLLGNEPELELATSDEAASQDAAIATYRAWVAEQLKTIRAQYPSVRLALAPLGQGDPARTERWLAGCSDLYPQADFLAEHCYTEGRAFDDPDWGGRYRQLAARFPGRPIHITEVDDNGALAEAPPSERAAHYAAYIRSVADAGLVETLSLFTLRGTPDDAFHPAWWFLTPEIVGAVATARSGTTMAEPGSMAEETPMTNDWAGAARQAAERAGLDRPDRFARQIEVESDGFNEDVIRGRRLSPAGARGIAQFMTPTGAWVASQLGYTPDAFWADPEKQLAGAAWLMARYLGQYEEDWAHALAAYNAGPGSLARWLDPDDILMPYPETVGYVARILGCSNDQARRMLLPPDGGSPTPIALPGLAYDPDVPYSPDDRQWDDWTCAIHTVQQALESVGSRLSYQDVYRLMVPVLDDATVGLHDRTGRSLVGLFERLGYAAHASSPTTFDEAWGLAGHEPLCLTLWGWNHWVFVRRRAGPDALALSNSAPGWMGVDQTLTREQWDALVGEGAALVAIDIPEGEDPVALADLQTQLAQQQGINTEMATQLADKDRRLMSVVEGLAVVADDLVPQMVSEPSEAQRQLIADRVTVIRVERVGPKPANV